jgi:hypothetical protein
MAVLAIPLLEAAGTALAEAFPALLGGAAAAGILSLPGDTAKDKSKAQPSTRAIAKQDESCKKCPPDSGGLVNRNWNMSELSREYQARVTGFAPRTEWSFSGLDFDGFRSTQCLLQEAKARYDQFFDPDDGQPRFFFSLGGERNIRRQARTQSIVVAINPPSQLAWYFMEPLSFRYFSRLFATEAPVINTLLQP